MLSLETGRLRPTTIADTDAVLALMTTPAVRRFLCDDKILSKQDIESILSESDRHDVNGLGLWAIETEAQAMAGLVGLMPVSGPLLDIPEMRDQIEPTIALHPRYWGQGLARRALLSVIEHARISLSLSRLVAAVDVPNEESHHLLQSCDFKICGTTSGIAHELKLYNRSLTLPAII